MILQRARPHPLPARFRHPRGLTRRRSRRTADLRVDIDLTAEMIGVMKQSYRVAFGLPGETRFGDVAAAQPPDPD